LNVFRYSNSLHFLHESNSIPFIFSFLLTTLMSGPEPEDHYTILGAHPEAHFSEIKESYRRLVLKCHPDKQQQQGGAASERFVRIQEAWEVLSDARLRATYDAQRHSSFYPPSSPPQDNSHCCHHHSFLSYPLPHPADGQVAELPVDTEVDLDEVPFDENVGVYTYTCRCGHHIHISEDALESNVDTFSCLGCSLVHKILYQKSC